MNDVKFAVRQFLNVFAAILALKRIAARAGEGTTGEHPAMGADVVVPAAAHAQPREFAVEHEKTMKQSKPLLRKQVTHFGYSSDWYLLSR